MEDIHESSSGTGKGLRVPLWLSPRILGARYDWKPFFRLIRPWHSKTNDVCDGTCVATIVLRRYKGINIRILIGRILAGIRH